MKTKRKYKPHRKFTGIRKSITQRQFNLIKKYIDWGICPRGACVMSEVPYFVFKNHCIRNNLPNLLAKTNKQIKHEREVACENNLKKIKQLMKGGTSTGQACISVGISHKVFYDYCIRKGIKLEWK